MHELSIANSLVELIVQQVDKDDLPSARCIRLRVGALSCVHPDALQFSFELVAQNTLLHDAKLEIEMVPISIYCANCDSVEPLDGIQSFLCPRCQTPSADIRAGRELELHSIEFDSALT
jgi:hydrogenase nickel incorporation protein HypA/HybF